MLTAYQKATGPKAVLNGSGLLVCRDKPGIAFKESRLRGNYRQRNGYFNV